MADKLPEIEPETLVDTISDVEAKALLKTPAEKLPEVKVEILLHRIGDVDPGALVDTLPDTTSRCGGRVTRRDTNRCRG